MPSYREAIQQTGVGILLRLRIQPRAARTEVMGLHGDAIRIRASAPPIDGGANEALLRRIGLQKVIDSLGLSEG